MRPERAARGSPDEDRLSAVFKAVSGVSYFTFLVGDGGGEVEWGGVKLSCADEWW